MWLTILLVISNICLWIWLIYEERWSRAVDDELEELHRKDKLKLNSAYGRCETLVSHATTTSGTMVSNLYHDTDSVTEESEEQNEP